MLAIVSMILAVSCGKDERLERRGDSLTTDRMIEAFVLYPEEEELRDSNVVPSAPGAAEK